MKKLLLFIPLLGLSGCDKKWWSEYYSSEEAAMIDDLSANLHSYQEEIKDKMESLESKIDDLESKISDIELKLL